MEDERKTKKELISELNKLRQSESEWKGFQEEIKQTRVNEEKFTKAFLQNSIPTAISTLKEGRYVDVSDAFLKFLECRRDEIIGHTAIECGFIKEEERLSYLHKLNEDGRIENFELRVRTKKGTVKHGLFNAVMMTLSNEKYLLSVMTDISGRWRAEMALAKSEEKFRLITENIVDCVALVDTSGTYQYVTPSYKETLGYDSEDMIGNEGFRYTHPDDLERVLHICMEGIEQGRREVRYETRLRHKNGHYVPMDLRVRSLKDQQGKIVGGVLAGRDITERRQTEEKLQESEEKFRIIMESSPTGLLMYQNNMWLYANPAAMEITGYTAQELRDIPFASFAHPDDKEILQTRAQMRQKGEISTKFHYEVRIIAKDGTVKWIDLSSASIFLNGSPAGIVSAVDITERKRMENELLEKEELLRINMDEAPDAVYMNDWEGKYIYANSLCEKITGYKNEEFVGKKFTEINGLTASSRITALEMVRQSEMGKKTSIAELELIIKDGSIIPVELKICVLLRNGKKVVLGFFRDISTRKNTEEELESYREHLENMVKERMEELETKNITLQELNTTLKVLLKQRENDKKDMEERFVMNIRNLVLPYVEQMKKRRLDVGQRSYLDIIETHLHDIATPLMKNLRQFNLTPKEIKVAAFIRQGKSTKEIAEILGLAASSIDSHRKSIRNKIGLSDRKINLQTHLELLEH